VVEICVARGDTSVFLLEHLRTKGDSRSLLLFNTFTGFASESVRIELFERGKNHDEYDKFQYGDERLLCRNLRGAGYERFRTYKGDTSTFDWSRVAPVGAVLLDIGLYLPTKRILEAIYPHLCPGGGIVVDDCFADTA